jgi:hypothetical protein
MDELLKRVAAEHKELLQYRAIGTVEEFEIYKLGDCMNDCEHYGNCSNYIYSKGYNKAIDEYMNKLCNKCLDMKNECYQLECPFCDDGCDIVNIAEQMKAGVKNEDNC